ncbi:MAG: hypothetical protein CVU39_18645 [Chloroflexi bacterium HGW-Chloroflexi-10]|nr:MAG: hypothetical protein CVU39_18645 [Chloroflexi bacterium HGW-Chloroflexi-10]
MKIIQELENPHLFSQNLFQKMKQVNPAFENIEFYEFQYGLDNLIPNQGWIAIDLYPIQKIELDICQMEFYTNVKIKPIVNNRIVPDEQITQLTRMLFKGLVTDFYSTDWVNTYFYFDIRGFFFLPRTNYYSKEVIDHFGGVPYLSFEKKQTRFKRFLDIGYKDYKNANAEVDLAFIKIIEEVIKKDGTPILLTIAGPTAAGKTEIVSRLRVELEGKGHFVTSIEMDHFWKDKDYRDTHQVTGIETIHFELFKKCMHDILQGRKTCIPQYDFYTSISSHDLQGEIKPGYTSIEIEPADIVFLEGNFPFHLADISQFLGIKIVYMSDDDIRLKRKWKRDIDYRKKYDPIYFQNRYFKTQFIRAQEIYLPLMKICDIVVDTSAANLWLTDNLKNSLNL